MASISSRRVAVRRAATLLHRVPARRRAVEAVHEQHRVGRAVARAVLARGRRGTAGDEHDRDDHVARSAGTRRRNTAGSGRSGGVRVVVAPAGRAAVASPGARPRASRPDRRERAGPAARARRPAAVGARASARRRRWRALVPADARVIASPLLRTRETAGAFGRPVEVDERWIELDYGELDGLPLRDVPADLWRAWRADPALRARPAASRWPRSACGCGRRASELARRDPRRATSSS